MRASRLINILTTLQAKGLVTAEALAAENDVSVRTIYRDIDALSLSGVPVYSERGSDGGYRLLDGYRVRLNGLSSAEAEAMFLSGIPGAAADLGLGSLMAGAQKKLTAALPEDLRESARRMQSKFHLDAPTWLAEGEQPVYLQAIADAVWNSKRIRMRYRSWKAEKNRVAEPLGIVIKGGAWYLVARVDDTPRTYRISRVLDLIVTDEHFDWPKTFDLAAYWDDNTRRLERELYPNWAVVRLSGWGLKEVEHMSPPYVRTNLEFIGEPNEQGWRTVRLPVAQERMAVSEMLKLGTEVEVIDPPELRAAMHRAVKSLIARYSEASDLTR
ncbi:transcriptional regulator [Rhizobium sp. Root274]|uniref:helix-turn-helix transcriptional regulator n=1 Tax=unclassified Rhizobium TaxID=2613769 RepID=UPI000715EC6C|nr:MULTISPECIES: YafY family protein [unclassified Rhizobium]KQW30899.1 transcriptional regulator [Rhizobium sp. Root1240]KRD32444.1 transcriptional regulator [Rhizobium sp. Root274]